MTANQKVFLIFIAIVVAGATISSVSELMRTPTILDALPTGCAVSIEGKKP